MKFLWVTLLAAPLAMVAAAPAPQSSVDLGPLEKRVDCRAIACGMFVTCARMGCQNCGTDQRCY